MNAIKNYFKTKKLNLLATLLGLTYGFLFANTIINDWDNLKRSFMEGVESTYTNNNPFKGEARRNHYMVLSQKKGAFNYPDSLVNLANHTTVKTINKSVIAFESSGSGTKYFKWYDSMFHLLPLFVFVFYVMIPFHFTKLLGRIKKNLIFERDNIRLIRWLGVELLIIYFGNVLFNYINYKANASTFKFADYEIGMDSMDAIWLLFSIVVLLVAEILSKALELKEEQELTI
ncbi:MAG TPA: DUF2975 domain-containing protein [Prolixibacteraceae bacterium]|nr:DUF2975 domain-containing protein [Prolixibacteraceae bacterium]